MIVGGEGETNPRMEVANMDQGMGFLPGVVIDQHFAQRGRLGRLLAAVAQQPVVLGFGICSPITQKFTVRFHVRLSPLCDYYGIETASPRFYTVKSAG